MEGPFVPLGTEPARRQIEGNRTERISQFFYLAALNDGAQACLHRAFNCVGAQRLLRLTQELLIEFNRGLHGIAPCSRIIDAHTIPEFIWASID